MITQVALSKVLKGLYSAAIAVLGALAAVLTGNLGFSDLTDGQWVAVLLAGVVAFGGTFRLAGWAGPPIPGAPKEGG